MALRDQPYIPLYIQDFMTDEKLAECSASATGVYIRLMCLMHKSEHYGKILLKQKYKQTSKHHINFALQIAKHLPYELNVIEDGLFELIEECVLVIEGDFLVQKRMVKDHDISEKRAKSGRKGGINSTTKRSQKDIDVSLDFAQANFKANSENENEYNNSINSEKIILKNGEQKIILKRFIPYLNEMLSDQVAIETLCMNNGLSLNDVTDYIKQFFILRTNENNQEVQSTYDAQSYFSRWLTCELEKEKSRNNKNKTNGKEAIQQPIGAGINFIRTNATASR